MKRPLSSFEALLADELIYFPENISIHGDVRHGNGTSLTHEEAQRLMWVMEPAASATQKIVLPDPQRFRISQHMVSPKTILNFSGLPNSSAHVSGEGHLEIYAGMLVTCASLPATLDLVNDIVTSGRVPDLNTFKPPPEAIEEVHQLMMAWDDSAQVNWARLTLPARIAAGSRSLARGMARIVVGHELTHWFETIYKEAEWATMLNEVKQHVSTWLTEETLLVPPRVVQNARGLLKNPAVFDSWAREAHADYGAFDFFHASETRGGWNKTPEALMRAYVHIALFFSLLTLFEVWANLRGVRVDVSTHPPAIVRRALFCHIEAKRMNIKISPHEFLYRQFGAGMITAALMETIIGGYVSQRARR